MCKHQISFYLTIKFVFHWVENVVGKGENAPFPAMFSKDQFLWGHNNKGLFGEEFSKTIDKI